jgi:hypothetical protein
MAGLRAMIKREIQKREEDGQQWPAFAFIVNDDAPDLDIDAAIEAIIVRAGDPSAPRVTIKRRQQEAVVAALRAKYPRRWIIMNPIIRPSMSHADRPDVRWKGDNLADAQLARAAERISRLRNESR